VAASTAVRGTFADDDIRTSSSRRSFDIAAAAAATVYDSDDHRFSPDMLVLSPIQVCVSFLGDRFVKTVRTVPLDRCLSVCPVLSVTSVTLVYCGQTAGWIRIPLGTEVGLSPGDIVLNRDPATPSKGAQQPLPHFSAHACLSYC